MTLFKAFEQKVEVNGETVLSVVAGMSSFKDKALEILSSNGISNPQPGQWYSQQSWLNAFKEIAEKIGDATLKQIGRKIPENAKWPPQVDNVEKALGSIDVAYHMNHRNGEIGHYKFIKTGDNSGTMICNNPYPDAFDLGIIEATAKKFGKNTMISATIDATKPTRTKGGESTTYLIKW